MLIREALMRYRRKTLLAALVALIATYSLTVIVSVFIVGSDRESFLFSVRHGPAIVMATLNEGPAHYAKTCSIVAKGECVLMNAAEIKGEMSDAAYQIGSHNQIIIRSIGHYKESISPGGVSVAKAIIGNRYCNFSGNPFNYICYYVYKIDKSRRAICSDTDSGRETCGIIEYI